LRDALREFVLDGATLRAAGDGIPLAGLVPVGPRFRWQPDGRPCSIRRTWLDTFDWRLYRAGLTLERTGRPRGPAEYRLTGRDGELIAAQPATPATTAASATTPAGSRSPRTAQQSWLLSALPEGPLREQLAPVVGVRALLPVARAVSTARQLRVLNDDDKTVARVTVDQMAPGPRAPGLPPRLIITPLRGYLSQADRLAELLTAADGVTEASTGPLEQALAAAGRHPGDYTGKVSVRLDPQQPAAAAVATVLTSLLDTLEVNVPGTIRDIDTEFLHDLRVAVRRTRSGLKLAGDVLPSGLAARFRPEFKRLGDLTTPTRDLDVYLLGFGGMAAGLDAAPATDLEPFRAHLARKRAAEQRQLARGLRNPEFSVLTRDWREALAAVPASRRARPTARALADQRIRKAHRRVLADGSAITPASAPEALHELRKRAKELRYALEIFGSLYDPGAHWQAVRELKALQDCLGTFQDTQVQMDELRAFAGEMMAGRTVPAATLLAMGEVAAGLARQQHAARSEFAGRFRDFAGPGGQSWILAMTGEARG
jgi:CHAD domain-containing protein